MNNENVTENTVIDLRSCNLDYKSEDDFRFAMSCGGESEFIWKGKTYDIVHDPDGVVIYEAHNPDESKYQTTDELLEHYIGSDKLKDIITKVDVTARSR